jgi:hypothetical protein
MSSKKNQQLGNMAKKSPKPRAKRSVRSGVKKAQLVKSNQETIANIWKTIKSNQVLKTC